MCQNKLTIFINRLKKIGIDIEIFGNLPWVYITKINNKKVKEIFFSDYGFTLAFLPYKPKEEIEFTDIKEIFKLIRKYIC